MESHFKECGATCLQPAHRATRAWEMAPQPGRGHTVRGGGLGGALLPPPFSFPPTFVEAEPGWLRLASRLASSHAYAAAAAAAVSPDSRLPRPPPPRPPLPRPGRGGARTGPNLAARPTASITTHSDLPASASSRAAKSLASLASRSSCCCRPSSPDWPGRSQASSCPGPAVRSNCFFRETLT